MGRVIAVDIGGTHMRAAQYNPHAPEPLAHDRVLTLAGEPGAYDRLKSLVQSVWPAGEPVLAIGAASPGPLDPRSGVILRTANIPEWTTFPVVKRLSEDFGVPAFLIQVIYNIFDQAPEDELFERAQRDGIGIIARVPFDEGGLTGKLTADTEFPDEDWRATYFGPENLGPTVERDRRLEQILTDGMTLPELALRFILHHPAVSTVIPGMRRPEHARANLAVSDGTALDPALLAELRAHRWDRVPTAWSM